MLLVANVPAVSANAFDVQVASGASYYWPGWAVLNPTMYVQVYAGAAGMDFWVSGSLLTGPPIAAVNTDLAQLGIAIPTDAP